MTASLSRHLPIPSWPVDGGATFRGRRVLGGHKTWRGVVVGVIMGTLFFLFQQWVFQYEWAQSISVLEYADTSWLFGLLLALGAIGGDVVKSFFKRQIRVAPGKPWMPFDQIDYVVGAIGLGSVIYFPGWDYLIVALGLGFGLHVIINLLSYLLKLQKNKL